MCRTTHWHIFHDIFRARVQVFPLLIVNFGHYFLSCMHIIPSQKCAGNYLSNLDVQCIHYMYTKYVPKLIKMKSSVKYHVPNNGVYDNKWSNIKKNWTSKAFIFRFQLSCPHSKWIWITKLGPLYGVGARNIIWGSTFCNTLTIIYFIFLFEAECKM